MAPGMIVGSQIRSHHTLVQVQGEPDGAPSHGGALCISAAGRPVAVISQLWGHNMHPVAGRLLLLWAPSHRGMSGAPEAGSPVSS